MDKFKNLIGKKIVQGVAELSDSSISDEKIKSLANDNGFKEVRIFKTTDFITTDYNTDRLNIIVNDTQTIKDISKG
jgi:hypothetical protein